MKNNKLLLTSALLSGVILFSSSIYLKKNTTSFSRINKAIDSKEEDKDAGGAAQWLFDIQKNQITGIISANDVMKTREEVAQRMLSRSSNAALGLDWNELGPDNVGGRTRAILIDKLTPNKIFAGAASGGIWVSNNGGSTWSNVAGFDQQPNIVITCITQAANGDIYAGTGEDLANGFNGTPASSFIGSGIYKSTDDGATFTLLPSTIPSATNSATSSITTRFLGVNNLGASPTNPNRIYAATRYGLQVTNNGGLTWFHPVRLGNGTANTSRTTDIDVASDGTVIAAIGGKAYISATGDSASYLAVPSTAGLPTSNIDRLELAFAPSDPNYIYASADKFVANGAPPHGKLLGVYQSIDKGVTWTTIGNGGSTQFDPLGTQGWYAQVLAVYQNDKTKIILGGLDTWIWKQANPNIPGVGQWNQASQWFLSPPNDKYVHADIHTIKFSSTNPNTFYIGCDGGVFRSVDGGNAFQPMNNGYNVTQFYSVAFEGDDPYVRGFIGGAQDNGTNYVSGHGNTTKTAKEIGGGDGAECEISYLNPNVSFSTIYYGALDRHATKGGNGSDFYSSTITTFLAAGSNASFITPIALYETKTATNSPDSVTFINQPVSQIAGTGNGSNKHFTGYLNLPQSSATIVPDSILIKSGLQVITDNGSGILLGNVDLTHTNTINYATGQFDFYFNTAPTTGTTVNITFDVMYASGSAITVIRPDYVSPLTFNTTGVVNPDDTVKTYDPFQAKLAVGFTGSVYMTKGCLNFSTTPIWMKIGTISGTAEELAWSADGDILYVGTSGGNLYRFSNLAPVKDSITGDIASPGCVVVKTQIASFTGRYITDISVNPIDPNKVVVSLGNYGNTAYVYYSTTAATCAAATSTTNFSLKQGTGVSKLPAMPVYTVLIEKNDPKRVIVGTEHGVYSTADITVSNPVWSPDNGISGYMPNIPVFELRQQRRDGTEVNNPYVIYAATHGRGAWKSETFKGTVTAGINNPNSSNSTAMESGIIIYPNPMNEKATIAFNLASSSNVVVSIFNLQGKLVKSINAGKLLSGEQKIEINSDELSKGTYLVSIDGVNVHATTKFVVVR